MNSKNFTISKIKYNIKNVLIPCLVLAGLCGIATGAFIFAFKWIAEKVIDFSFYAYSLASKNPLHAIILILALICLGVLSYLITKYAPNCRGGGIPTAVAFMRGFLSFNWVSNAFSLLASSLITFLGGVPLGNEGPSVQIGCAVGHGTSRLFARKNKAWDRYIMTGGACAGFAAATGTYMSGIIFALEEVHRRFSPLIFLTVATAITTSTITMDLLCSWTGMDSNLFHFLITEVLPLSALWAPIIIGLATGVLAVLYTKLYKLINKFLNVALKKVPQLVKVVSIFVIVGVLGIISNSFIGSGHKLIDGIMSGENALWYLLLIYLLVRAVTLLVATQTGITGGLFLPALTFGAITGELLAQTFVGIGILDTKYESVMIIIGMASFLAASSRIPITAIAFSIEALNGLNNIVPIALGVGVSYLVTLVVGEHAFTETIFENKVINSRKGKTVHVIDVHMPVMEGAFVIGKESRDILWPPSCAVLSVDKKHNIYDEDLHEGDRLHLRYKTTNPEETMQILENLLGKPNEEIDVEYVHQKDTHYSIPEQ